MAVGMILCMAAIYFNIQYVLTESLNLMDYFRNDYANEWDFQGKWNKNRWWKNLVYARFFFTII